MLEQLLDSSNYYFNLHAMPVILVSVIIFAIGLFILLQTKKSIKNIAFFMLCVSLSLWLFATGLVYLSNNPKTALLWYKYLTFFGVINIMPNAYLFSAASSGLLKKQRNFIFGAFLLSYIFYIVALTTDKFISSPHLYFWGYYPHYQPLNLAFIAFYLILFIAVLANLWYDYKRENITIKKNQVLIIIVGFIIGFTASTDFAAKIWTISIYPFGFIPMFIFICLLAYSIIRYKAFDIETAIHKTVAWVLASSIAFVPITILAYWLKPWYQKAPAFHVALLCSTIFYLLMLYIRYTQPKIDHLFQRRRYDLEEIADRFTEDLTHLKGIAGLIERIEDIIKDTLYPQRVAFFIYNEIENKYKAANTIDSPNKEVTDLKSEVPFLLWLAKNNRIAYREFVDIDPVYALIREEAKDYFNLTEAIVVIPLVLNEKLLGIINLGKKANLKRYSAVDFHFLTMLKNQSTIAISNSLLYENIEEKVRLRTKELMEVQRQLIQAEKLATMGTLAGGVAHEINNPLTAILTNVQMLLAENPVDAKLDRESLELIEEATQRCRVIVQKLMSYAKKPLGAAGVSEIDLLNVIKNVISFVGYQLEQENIKIIIEANEDTYKVSGNHNELEQVLTNIILNARDAIRKIKKGGTIYISLLKSDDWIRMEIKDEGTGIPQEIMSKIFDPFFTTKDVGKGLGLGLSICQAIIEKHNGLISIQSELNKGSTVTVQLPKAGVKINTEKVVVAKEA